MVLPDADWKNQSRHLLDWCFAGVVGVLFLVYLYHGWLEDGRLSLGLAMIIFLAGIIYFTPFWQPVLYLVVAIIVSTATVIWIWRGSWTQPVIQVAIGLHLLLTLLSVYLFNYEEPGVQPEPDPE